MTDLSPETEQWLERCHIGRNPENTPNWFDRSFGHPKDPEHPERGMVGDLGDLVFFGFMLFVAPFALLAFGLEDRDKAEELKRYGPTGKPKLCPPCQRGEALEKWEISPYWGGLPGEGTVDVCVRCRRPREWWDAKDPDYRGGE